MKLDPSVARWDDRKRKHWNDKKRKYWDDRRRGAGMTPLLAGKTVPLICPITIAVINDMCKNIEH